MQDRQAIAYYRVSTSRQGRSGLGIDAPRQAVERLAAAEDDPASPRRNRLSVDDEEQCSLPRLELGDAASAATARGR